MEPTQGRSGVPGRDRAEAGNGADAEAAKRPLITDQTMISRRAVIGGGLAGLGGFLLFPGLVMAQRAAPRDSFVILLKGIYRPVGHAPDLGLSTVDLNDGSYSTVPIYPISGVPGNTDTQKAIGHFYVQFDGDLCAYHIPGGSFAMRFLAGQEDVNIVDDGAGGSLLTGTWELTILQATGIYRPFAGGHNHMVDHLHFLASGDIDEYCICNVSRP